MVSGLILNESMVGFGFGSSGVGGVGVCISGSLDSSLASFSGVVMVIQLVVIPTKITIVSILMKNT